MLLERMEKGVTWESTMGHHHLFIVRLKHKIITTKEKKELGYGTQSVKWPRICVHHKSKSNFPCVGYMLSRRKVWSKLKR